MKLPTVFCAAFITACGAEKPSETEPEPATPVPDPFEFSVAETGPFEAGYRTLETSYEAPGGAGERTILINLWYPTESATGEAPAYQNLFTDPDVYSDAPLGRVAYEDGFPVVVHSHGYRGWGGNSSDLLRHFATHGWVAVAPDHKDNTLLNPAEPLPDAHFFQRPLDVRAALDALEQLEPGDPLAAKLDMTRVLMTGHSFGTYTCWASVGASYDSDAVAVTCAGELEGGPCTPDEEAVFSQADLSESRIDAVIPMAGGYRDEWFGANGHAGVGVPMMMMTGSDDSVDGEGVFDMVQRDDFSWLEVEGGCHQLFGFGDCDQIDNLEGFRIVNGYALAFARHHVLSASNDDIAALLNGSATLDERVTLTTR